MPPNHHLPSTIGLAAHDVVVRGTGEGGTEGVGGFGRSPHSQGPKSGGGGGFTVRKMNAL